MERILYKFNLDVTKPDAQKCLTGFSIGETETRRLLITLMNGRNPLELDGTENISMFVMKPSDTTPSIGGCTIDGSTITYDVLQSDVSEEGIVQMTLKIQHLTEEGDMSITYAAHFVLQVTDPNCDESHIPVQPQYSVLEALINEVEIIKESVVELDGIAEAWAVGTKNGVPVEPEDPQYNNSSKAWAEKSKEDALAAEGFAIAAGESEANASISATDASNSKSDAQSAATIANAKAGEADASATTAAEKASEAAASATTVVNKVDQALSAADTAIAKAGEAAASATTAGDKATEASTSATNASASEANALTYKQAAEAAAATARELVVGVEFEIDPTTGHLLYNNDAPYTFTVDNNGHLKWEVN